MSDEWKEITMSETWDFKVNNVIQGFYVRKEENIGPNKSNMYYLELNNSDIIGIWGNTVLDTRFKNLTPGEEVKVEYKGKLKSAKTGKEYHDFSVYHRPGPMKKVNEDVNPAEMPF